MGEAAVRAPFHRGGRAQRILVAVACKQRRAEALVLGERAGGDAGAVIGKRPCLAVPRKPHRRVGLAARIAVIIDAGDQVLRRRKRRADLENVLEAERPHADILDRAVEAKQPAAEVGDRVGHAEAVPG